MTEQLLVTVEDAAKCLGISRAKMYTLISSGEIRSVKIGRLRKISKNEMSRFIKEHEK